MAGRRLFILVEGNDDERFFQQIIAPPLYSRYPYLQIWKYAKKSNNKIVGFLQVIEQMGAEYIFVTDMDKTSVDLQREHVLSKFPILQPNRIAVVEKSIESWYLAGLTEEGHRDLGLNGRYPKTTETLGKPDFMSLIPTKATKIDLSLEMLSRYDFDLATKRNRSLREFRGRFVG